jgi:hypothetical protein
VRKGLVALMLIVLMLNLTGCFDANEIDNLLHIVAIHLRVHLNADILAVQSRIGYEKPELKTLLEKEFQKAVKFGMENVIKKCQSLNADVFLFGDHATRNFLTIIDLESYNWNSHFKDALITVEVEFAIRRTGTQVGSSPIKNSEGAG